MKKSIPFLTFLLYCSTLAYSQNLPPQMRFSADGRQIITGDQAPGGLYDSAQIRSVYLDFPQTNYWTLLTNNYATKIDLPATMTVDGVVYDSVGVRFKGQTSYMQTQNSQKKSFNISLDFVHPDQELMGYQTLNLNNSFQDASFLREVFFQHQVRRHIPAAQSNFVHLYINGQDWGLYPNVQQLNKDFLKEWFFSNDGINWRADRPDGLTGGGGPGMPGGGWGDGTAALNYLGADTSKYQTYYTLKSSDVDKPWDYLVATCNALNSTPLAELPDVLPRYLDIDRTLWHLASEIAFSDDDSYVYKGKMDYYVYYEVETGRMTPLEYDGNSVMKANAANWSPFYNESKVNYPLLNRLLAVPIWRQRYLAHLRTIIQDEMNPTVCNAMLDNYKNMIDALVQSDPKKLYSYSQFTTEIGVLKNYIQSRRTYLLNNAEVKQVAPVIASATLQNTAGQAWESPKSGEEAWVTAQVSAANGIFGVHLFYSDRLTGNFTAINMFDDGQHHDGAAADGLYGASLPGQSAGVWMRFYIEAVANTTARSASYLPAGAEHDVFVYQVQPQPATSVPVAINELMAANASTVTDETGDYDDWIELFNLSTDPVDISGFFLTDNPANLDKFEIPAGTVIPGHGYQIFWADEDGMDGPYHCNFKLSAGGEQIYLLDTSLAIVDSVTFGAQVTDFGYARVPNGSGNFVVQTPTFAANNNATAVSETRETAPQLHVFPNPASTVLTVQTDHLLDNSQPLQVFDLTGQLLFQTIPDGLQTMVEARHWPAGLYTVRYGQTLRKLAINR
ncbi:MAG: CotH kinase family protein [Saprospirales bacterium]|nr:CotH kinase family protein [Saprospirales bacterium]